jgi:hypothetical protein
MTTRAKMEQLRDRLRAPMWSVEPIDIQAIARDAAALVDALLKQEPVAWIAIKDMSDLRLFYAHEAYLYTSEQDDVGPQMPLYAAPTIAPVVPDDERVRKMCLRIDSAGHHLYCNYQMDGMDWCNCGCSDARAWLRDHSAAAHKLEKQGNSPISELLARYSEECCDFTDMAKVREVALRYVETMPDSHVRCLLYMLYAAPKPPTS